MTTKMKAPAHPGELIRDDILPAFGLNVVQAAEALGVARPGFNNLLNGHRALSIGMAFKLQAAFGVSAELLVNMQAAHDLATQRAKAEADAAPIKRLKPLAAT